MKESDFIKAIRNNEYTTIKEKGINLVIKELNKKDKEIERLNNIINELEEYIVRKLKEFNSPEEYYTLKQIDKIHYKLQELKGVDKE